VSLNKERDNDNRKYNIEEIYDDNSKDNNYNIHYNRDNKNLIIRIIVA